MQSKSQRQVVPGLCKNIIPRWDKSHWKSQRRLKRQAVQKHYQEPPMWDKSHWKKAKGKDTLSPGKSKAMQKLGTTMIKPSFFSLHQWSLANISATNARNTSNEKETHQLWNRVVPVQRPFRCSLERWTVTGKEMSLVTAQPTCTFLKLTQRHIWSQ